MAVKNVTSEQEFQTELDMNIGVIIIKFGAPWCAPCRTLDPILDEVGAEEKVTILKINVDELPEIASEFRVLGLPTTLYVKNKEVKYNAIGATSKTHILETIAKMNEESNEE